MSTGIKLCGVAYAASFVFLLAAAMSGRWVSEDTAQVICAVSGLYGIVAAVAGSAWFFTLANRGSK